MAKRKRKNAKRQSLITALVVLVIAAGSFCYSYFMQNPAPGTEGVSQPQESEQLQVYFIDVGQGDSSLIVCGEHSVLIDAGEAEYANDVIRQIQDLGISRLDCIVSTHPHSDHAGGLPYVIETIGTDMILMPALTEENIPTTRTYEALMAAVASSDAAVENPAPGDVYRFGDIVFTIYSPVFAEDSELNNMSIVFRLVYGNRSFLFTGDAEKEVEEELLNDGVILQSDVIKMPHHGSKTSSTEDFVTAVSPQYAIVSCGDGGKNHPNEDIVLRWQTIGTTVLRTDYAGTVIVTTDGESLTVQTEKTGAVS